MSEKKISTKAALDKISSLKHSFMGDKDQLLLEIDKIIKMTK